MEHAKRQAERAFWEAIHSHIPVCPLRSPLQALDEAIKEWDENERWVRMQVAAAKQRQYKAHWLRA